MGGYGSGRRSEHPILEETIGIRPRDLRATIRFVLGGGGEGRLRLVYPQGLRPALVITFLVRKHTSERCRLTIAYEPPAQLAEQSVELIATRQPLGGPSARRWWFVCPICARTTAGLFLHIGHWRCRCCARLIYRSSRQSDGRLGPLLRDLADAWRAPGVEAPGAALSDLPPPAGKDPLRSARSALNAPRAHRLRYKAGQLALRRLARGVPLYRERFNPGS